MSWFSTKILYKSKVGSSACDGDILCEESIFLLQAENLNDASNKAKVIAISNEHSYKNDQGEQVSWRFSKVLDIQDLCEDSLYDGVEVYSHMYYSRS